MRISDWSSDVCSSDLSFFLNLPSAPRSGRPGNALTRSICSPSSFTIGTVVSAILFTVSLLVIRFEAYNPTSLQILRTNPSQPVASSGINRPPRFIKAINKRSEEHTSELQSLMSNSYAVFCLKKKNGLHMKKKKNTTNISKSSQTPHPYN